MLTRQRQRAFFPEGLIGVSSSLFSFKKIFLKRDWLPSKQQCRVLGSAAEPALRSIYLVTDEVPKASHALNPSGIPKNVHNYCPHFAGGATAAEPLGRPIVRQGRRPVVGMGTTQDPQSLLTLLGRHPTTLLFFPIWIKSEDFAKNIPFPCFFPLLVRAPCFEPGPGSGTTDRAHFVHGAERVRLWGGCRSHSWEG